MKCWRSRLLGMLLLINSPVFVAFPTLAIEPPNQLSAHPELHNLVKPWLALVETEEEPTCGGALIDPHWVLTARHCVQLYCNGKARSIEVIVNRDGPRRLVAQDVSCFPNRDRNDTRSNDLALIRVQRGKGVTHEPEELPALAKPSATQQGIVIGWSSCRGFREEAHILEMTFVDNEICQPLLTNVALCRDIGELQAGQLCAGSTAENPCSGLQQGDSGSPMIQVVDGQPILIAIASEACPGNGLAVLESIAPYRTWIARKICKPERYRKKRYKKCLERFLDSLP